MLLRQGELDGNQKRSDFVAVVLLNLLSCNVMLLNLHARSVLLACDKHVVLLKPTCLERAKGP